MALLSLWLVNRRIIEPIRTLIEHIARLSQGKFAERVDASRADELGRLAVAANVLRDFRRYLHPPTAEHLHLDSASGELNAIARLMADGAREQFPRTDQVATAMHEMSATAQEVSRHAAEAAQAADAADHAAQQGEAVMRGTIASITDMSSEIASTAEVIRRLEGDSGRIGKVLEVIRGIADQTNLLALNAAIEAARRRRPRFCRGGRRGAHPGPAHRRIHRRDPPDHRYRADRRKQCGACHRERPGAQRTGSAR